jgi:glycosyltransferase involved in cell wall biosynthesis
MIPRRIAYVLNIFPKISETFIAGELAELRRRGVDLRILSLLPPRDEAQHAIVRRAGLDRLVEYDPAKFAAVVETFRPELLHAHFAREATEKARELSLLTGVPFTFTTHGYDIHRKPPPDFAARAAAARAVVTVSEANRDYIAKTFGVPRGHIRVISCGVDTERFCPAATSPTPPLMVCVARLVKVKNLGLLLEACGELRRRGTPFRCVVIGEGKERPGLEAARARLGLDSLVDLPGAADQDEILDWWRRATVGVLTSENEGMPVSLMEAAACGVPVVATRVGGIPELVADGVTGLLTPPGDAAACALALEKVLGDAGLRERMGAAARRRAVERFSVVQATEALLALWREVLVCPRQPSVTTAAIPDVRVSDPFGARADKALPTLAAALDFATAWSAFKRRLPRLSGEAGKLRLKTIHVIRHKPERRAVVEYEVKVRTPGAPDQKMTLIGKVRARRSGNEGYRLQDALWNAGFQADSADGISVPEPIGVIAEFQMWFQRKVPGVTVEKLIAGSEGIALARRVAEAACKLHRAGVATSRQHSMADELRILRTCFDQLTTAHPGWAGRLAAVMAACEALGANLPAPAACGIHRDFYPAQVIVDGNRLWVIDFDLYCLGDPGLDAGNFIGHVTEQALRESGRADALAGVERALEERFVELSGERVRPAVRAYATLTLARHIYLSAQFPERRTFTETILKLCEKRLHIT